MISAVDTRAAPTQRAVLGERVAGLSAVQFALLIAATVATHGGYFPTTWGWTALAYCWVAGMALLVRRRIHLSIPEIAMVVAALALAAWYALSIAWSTAPSDSVNELERALVYPTALLALMLLLRHTSIKLFLGWLLGGMTAICAYALATRLFPDRIGTFEAITVYRLSEPIGYWNALGAFAAMTALLALGFAARAKTRAGRAAAAAALPILLPTLYFTFGRGSWAALSFGLAIAFVFDRRRLQLAANVLALAPPIAIVVWLSSRSPALTTLGSPLARAAHQGHRLAVWILLLAAISGLIGLGLAALEHAAPVPRGLRVAFTATLATLAAAGLAAVFATAGGPGTLAHKAYRSFTSPPSEESNLTGRVLSLSSNGRIDLWHVAWHEASQDPLLGQGAGSYEQYWNQHRPTTMSVRDAHSLYLETFAELGVIGLVLLVGLLGVPFVAAWRSRSSLTPFALAAFAAYALHAAADWDWELSAFTVTALCCGAAPLVARRPGARLLALSTPARVGILTVLAAIAGFSLVALVGNRAIAQSRSAIGQASYARAVQEADRAAAWLPWSSDPYSLRGFAEYQQGKLAAAIADYRKALRKSPRDSSLWADLGDASRGRERAQAYARAHQLNPLDNSLPSAQG